MVGIITRRYGKFLPSAEDGWTGGWMDKWTWGGEQPPGLVHAGDGKAHLCVGDGSMGHVAFILYGLLQRD